MSERIAEAPAPESLHRRAAKGGFVSGVSFALTLGLNLIQVPILLRFWPQDTYGLWLSVGALAAYLTQLDGGHQAYVGNLLNRQHVEDRALFKRTLASAVSIAALTAALQILLTLLFCFSGKAASWLGISVGQSADYSLAVVIYTVGWISTGSVGAILVRLFPPRGDFVRSTWWSIGMRLSQFSAVVLAAYLGWGVVGTTLLFASTVFVVNIFLLADIRRLYPDLFPWWRGVDWYAGLCNLARSGVVTIVGLLDLFSLQGVVLLVTGVLGTAMVPLFTTLRTMANMAMQGTGFLLNPIQPDLVRYHVQNEGRKLTAVFEFFWFATGLLINCGIVLGLLVVEPIYTLWTQGKLPFDKTLFVWLTSAVLVRTLASPFQVYLTSVNQLRALTILSLVRAFLTVGGVILLSSRWGLSGVGAALFSAEFFGSLLMPAWYAIKELKLIGGRLGCSLWYAAISMSLAILALAGFSFIRDVAISRWLAVMVFPIATVSWMQWRVLSDDVKVRIRSMITPPLWSRKTVSSVP